MKYVWVRNASTATFTESMRYRVFMYAKKSHVEVALTDAGQFAKRLPKTLKKAPYVSLADDGEVNFAWQWDGNFIDLGFYGTGTYSFYAKDKNGNELYGDDIPVTSIPDDLNKLLIY